MFERRGMPVLYCGVGKVNAAYALTRRLADYRHGGHALPHVINFGTAGSHRASDRHRRRVSRIRSARHGCERARRAARHDAVRCWRAGAPEFPALFAQLTPAVCGTGDSFATTQCAVECDVLDMEGYALAKVCWLERTRFTAVKWVTDGADHTAGAGPANQSLHHAAERFLQLYEHLEEKDS